MDVAEVLADSLEADFAEAFAFEEFNRMQREAQFIEPRTC